MVFSNAKRSDVLVKLAKAAKLCKEVGLVGWDRWLREIVIRKVGHYEGPDCKDLLETLKKDKDAKYEVDLFETMLCNELSTYIDIMPLDRGEAVKQAPPFELLNDIVLAQASALEYLLGHILVMRDSTFQGENQCCESGVPLEYLHTLIRAFHNKVLLLGFVGKQHSVLYSELSEKCAELMEQYKAYPSEEIERVNEYYGRTCLGQPYESKKSKKQSQERKDGE